jgi:hypothetical protein
MDTERDKWSRNELEEVFGIYYLTKTSIHKSNSVIIDLASKLGKKIRGVENQLLMFRAVEKELKEKTVYGRKNYNKLVKEIYIEKTEKMKNTDYANQETNSVLNYPQRFKNFVKTNDGAVRRSSDKLSGRPIGEMIILPIHEFINKVIVNTNNNYKILFLIGGPGNGKTDATDYAFDTFISSQKLTETEATNIRKSYASKFSDNDNYYSLCEIHGNSFYCIQDATARMKSTKTSLEAFVKVYEEFKISAGGILIVCINRGVLQDFLKQTANNPEINNLIKEVEDCSNLEAYFKNKSNLNIGFNYPSFKSAISIYPLDKSSLFSANSEVHRNICDLIYNSDWSTSDNKNFNRDYFISMSKDLADLINLYEIKNNKKLTFREYYHWLHILFTPDKVNLQILNDSPLLHLWKLATNQSISTVIELISKLKHLELKKELNPLLTDLQKLNHLIDQNKSIKSVQEFNPSFISTLWDTEQIYSFITLIRDEISTPNFNIENGLNIDFSYHQLSGIEQSEIHQITLLIDIYSKIDNHILDTKTKEIETIRKFLLIVIRNFLCAIDFRLKGHFYFKTELLEFRKLDEFGSKEIQLTLRKLLRIRDDGSGFYKIKVALNNNIWEYSFSSENVIEGDIDNLEIAFDFKKIAYQDKPPIELKLFVSKFHESSEIVTFIDFGTFLNIRESDSLFNQEFKRIASTISPNFKLWLNSESEKFVAGRFNEIDTIKIPRIALVRSRSNNRISIEKHESI